MQAAGGRSKAFSRPPEAGRATQLVDGIPYTPDASQSIADGFLDSHPPTVALVTEWVRVVAAHRAWGFDSPEDIVQDALLALLCNLRKQRFQQGDLRAYVRRITKNLCVSSYRKARTRRGHVPVTDETPAPAASTGALSLERTSMARRVLDGLDEPCRELIIQAYLRGFSRREIAARLGISETAAKVRLFRCLERARSQLEGSDAEIV